ETGLPRPLQRLAYIRDEVVGVLQSHRQPQRAAADAEFGTRLVGQALVRGGRRMRDQALRVAEIVGHLDYVERVLEAEGLRLPARDIEADQRRAALHLLFHDIRLRVVVAA